MHAKSEGNMPGVIKSLSIDKNRDYIIMSNERTPFV